MLADTTSNTPRLPLTPFDFGHSGTMAHFTNPIEPKEIFITPSGELVEIDESQAWFWSEEWQAGEREVDEYIATGNYEEYDSLDDMFRALLDE